MRKVLILLTAAAVLLFPVAAAAQAAVSIETLQAEFWPEYDRPEMLVIYRIQLSQDTTLPATLNIRIPAAVGEPNAVAVADASGSLVNAAYTRTEQGEYATLAVQAASRLVQVEYYDAALEKDGPARSYVDRIRFDYPIGNLVLRVQQPAGASGMTIGPVNGTPAAEGDGLTYYYAGLGALEAGEEIEVSVDYQKADDTLSVDAVATGGPAEASGFSANPIQYLAIGLGVIGLGLLGWAAFKQFGGRLLRPAARKPRARKRSTGAGGAAMFCHNCGTQALPGDKFCRECGTQLRR
ncbi:MAG: zinc ribbon domain-containing protein [Chloroflexi bacterium]|nr:zinc ribbon domain-containing protein [Chloroflexota bacterium]